MAETVQALNSQKTEIYSSSLSSNTNSHENRFERLSQEQIEKAAELLKEHSEYLTDETLNMVALEILRRDSNVRATLNPVEIKRWRDENPEQAAIADIILEVAAGARNLILMPYTKELSETINNGIKNNKNLWKRLFAKTKTEIVQETYNLLANSQLIKERLAQSEAEIKTNNAAASLVLSEARKEANQIIEKAKLKAAQVTARADFEVEHAKKELAEIKEIQRRLLESNGDINRVFEQTVKKEHEKKQREAEEIGNEYIKSLLVIFNLKSEPGGSTRRKTDSAIVFIIKFLNYLMGFQMRFGVQARIELANCMGEKINAACISRDWDFSEYIPDVGWTNRPFIFSGILSKMTEYIMSPTVNLEELINAYKDNLEQFRQTEKVKSQEKMDAVENVFLVLKNLELKNETGEV